MTARMHLCDACAANATKLAPRAPAPHHAWRRAGATPTLYRMAVTLLLEQHGQALGYRSIERALRRVRDTPDTARDGEAALQRLRLLAATVGQRRWDHVDALCRRPDVAVPVLHRALYRAAFADGVHCAIRHATRVWSTLYPEC